MKSLNYLIVELEDSYNNEIIEGGKSVVVNSTIEDVFYINRVAKVVCSPEYTVIPVNSEVVVHHNILRLRNNHKGNQVDSSFYIGNNRYFVPLTEVFMYRYDSNWITLDPYCFIKPIPRKSGSGFSLSLNEETHKGFIKNRGIIKYLNKSLKDQGVRVGDEIMFSDYSEYEFTIDNELLYKMSTKDILGVI